MSLELKTAPQAFIPGMISHMSEICRDHFIRTQAIKEFAASEKAHSIAILERGIWYPIDYCEALEKFGYQDRLNWAVQTGCSYHGYMPDTFTALGDPSFATGRRLCEYRVSEGTLPSVALESIQKTWVLLDCRAAIDIAAYRALLDILGKDKFDVLFSSESNTPLQIGGRCPLTTKLLKEVELQTSAGLKPGDICYFVNGASYTEKHPLAHGRGYNTVYSGVTQAGPKFMALGFEPEGRNVPGIDQAFTQEYNRPQELRFMNSAVISHTFRTAILRDEKASKDFVEAHANRQMTPEEFQKEPTHPSFQNRPVEGRMFLTVHRFRLGKIQKLVNASLEDVRRVFESL